MNDQTSTIVGRHAARGTWLAGIAAAVTLGGCAAPTPPARILAPATPSPASSEDRWRSSLEGEFDRRHWPTIRFEIPMAAVACNPTYATPVVSDDDGVGRLMETRAFPTIDTAMSTDVDRSRVRWSALSAPFIAAFDLVASPFRMIGSPPNSTVLEPNDDWQLLPDGEAPSRAEETKDVDADTAIDATTPDEQPRSTADSGASDVEDGPSIDIADTGGWTIKPVFDRPADAAAGKEVSE